jgi:hypothetical protein
VACTRCLSHCERPPLPLRSLSAAMHDMRYHWAPVGSRLTQGDLRDLLRSGAGGIRPQWIASCCAWRGRFGTRCVKTVLAKLRRTARICMNTRKGAGIWRTQLTSAPRQGCGLRIPRRLVLIDACWTSWVLINTDIKSKFRSLNAIYWRANGISHCLTRATQYLRQFLQVWSAFQLLYSGTLVLSSVQRDTRETS